MCESYRIKKPEKKLRRLLHTELGEVTHEYFNFKEQYIGCSPLKAPKSSEALPPTYQNYFVITKDREKLIKSIHYEDSELDIDKIEELYRLSLNFASLFRSYPLLTIITTQPLEECINPCPISHSVTLYPEIISFDEYDVEKHIQQIEDKVESGEKFKKVEALDIIFIMKAVKKDHMKILKHLCCLLTEMNVDDDFKFNLKKAMFFVIHIYANTVSEIKKFEKIIKIKRKSH